MHNKLIIANWKENPATEREALKLFGETARAKRGKNVEVVVCPPVVYLEAVVKKMRGLNLKKGIAIGAQDVFWEDEGPFTSEMGSRMLKSFGVTYVIIGHSERRKLLHETDAMVNKKVRAALAAGLKVILCVGEPLSVRKKGIAAAKKFIKNQLTKDLQNLYLIPDNASPLLGTTDSVTRLMPLTESSRLHPRLFIAYEPLWSIGTGRNDTPRDASAIASFIKKTICHLPAPSLVEGPFAICPVLYGGSATGENVLDYIQSKDVDGVLVGGASLKGSEMKKMIEGVGR